MWHHKPQCVAPFCSCQPHDDYSAHGLQFNVLLWLHVVRLQALIVLLRLEAVGLQPFVTWLCLQAMGLQLCNILLCLQAMGLQQLVHNLLPKATILGSSLPSDAWGTPAFVRRSLRGAVFLGSKAYDEGVAGCLLHGPLQVGDPHSYAVSKLSADCIGMEHVCFSLQSRLNLLQHSACAC